ncbi:hypothetical protein [Cerasicoccus arenae]|uniref:Uncharacterized protein n=1 Tax=Cerasicoccus arenae TaxID=424488 RepID=A0A8J3DFX8_9BACT|nr:hypothetical protein [Cerasicoccus arenae]MBK1858159.1 hypothetical protein [Cerasicoccus arenae]GHB96849.1 hypothetical protein GCM10007047_11010 [Cerasicoccus arenae]
MNQPEHSSDPLDQLLASQPVTPAPDFAARTLARLMAEETAQKGGGEAFDAELDELLAMQPIAPSGQLADRVLAELNAKEVTQPEDDNKVVGFPSWVVAIGGIAAAMVIGMFCFITLFKYADHQRSSETFASTTTAAPVVETPGIEPIPEVVELVMVADNVSRDASVTSVREILIDEGLSPSSEVLEYETVLTLDDTLGDILLLADIDTLDTLQAFLN